MTIKRWFSRKVNLGNYETADFGCEISTEVEKNHEQVSKELFEICKKEVEKSINKFQSNILTEKLNLQKKLLKDELKVLSRFPKDNKRKITFIKFKLEIVDDLLKDVSSS